MVDIAKRSIAEGRGGRWIRRNDYDRPKFAVAHSRRELATTPKAQDRLRPAKRMSRGACSLSALINQAASRWRRRCRAPTAPMPAASSRNVLGSGTTVAGDAVSGTGLPIEPKRLGESGGPFRRSDELLPARKPSSSFTSLPQRCPSSDADKPPRKNCPVAVLKLKLNPASWCAVLFTPKDAAPRNPSNVSDKTSPSRIAPSPALA